ncbi:MAG: hypothetical protein HY317_01205 [Acidobacteria bacterium]|nr:hypothetical protein [Acidobacteriota bacterium]
MKLLPVDPERLREQFPHLTADDLEAYVAVTRKVLADPGAKGRVMRGIMEAATAGRDKEAAGDSPSPDEALALRYLRAVEKMQAPVARRRG